MIWKLTRGGEAIGFVRGTRAEALRAVQRLADRRGESIGIQQNPSHTPRVGEVWRGIRGDRCRIVKVAGNQVTVLQLDTGHRVTSHLSDFLATYKPPAAARSNPKRGPYGAPLWTVRDARGRIFWRGEAVAKDEALGNAERSQAGKSDPPEPWTATRDNPKRKGRKNPAPYKLTWQSRGPSGLHSAPEGGARDSGTWKRARSAGPCGSARATGRAARAGRRRLGRRRVSGFSAIVKRAIVHTVTDIGQLTPAEKRELVKAVRAGYLEKGKGGPFPMIKTVYAVRGYPFAAERERMIDEMMRLPNPGGRKRETAATHPWLVGGRKRFTNREDAMAAAAELFNRTGVIVAVEFSPTWPPPRTPNPRGHDPELDDAVLRIRRGLKRRGGVNWSVKRGTGSVYGWIYIRSPRGDMTPDEQRYLAKLLGLETVHQQGVMIPSGGRERAEYVARAEGRAASNPRGGPQIVYNKLLGGWYVVVGPHQTPLNGRFDSKAEAQAWLGRRGAGNPRGKDIKVGDRVQYTAAFLKSAGLHVGPWGFLKGTVLEVRPSGSMVIATVKWDGEDEPQRMAVGVLKTIGHLEPNPRTLSVPERHQLKIARDTLKMSDAGARIMGGPTKAEAREIILRLTGRPAPNRRPNGRFVRGGARARRAVGSGRVNPRSAAEGARAMAQMWHDSPRWSPRSSTVRVPPRPRALAKLGDLVSVVYRSNKYAGTPDNPQGRPQLHEHRTKRPHPVLAADPDGHIHIVGGRMIPTADGLVN